MPGKVMSRPCNGSLSAGRPAYAERTDPWSTRSRMMRHNTHRTVALTAFLAAGFGGMTAARAAEFATVVSSTPVLASVPVARQVCSDGQQLVQQRPSGAGAL